MQIITTVTQKGQVTLPKDIRSRFNIDKYDKVIVEPATDHIKIRPLLDIIDLAGTFKIKGKKKVLKARDVLEKEYQRI